MSSIPVLVNTATTLTAVVAVHLADPRTTRVATTRIHPGVNLVRIENQEGHVTGLYIPQIKVTMTPGVRVILSNTKVKAEMIIKASSHHTRLYKTRWTREDMRARIRAAVELTKSLPGDTV